MEWASASTINVKVCDNCRSQAQHTHVNVWKTDADCITHSLSSQIGSKSLGGAKAKHVESWKPDAISISNSLSSCSGSDSRSDSDDDLQFRCLSCTVVTSLVAMLLIVLLDGGVDVWNCPCALLLNVEGTESNIDIAHVSPILTP